MTDEHFYRHARGVLLRELCPDGLAWFPPLTRSGSGDYTHDRDQWLKGVTPSVVLDSVKKHR
jgi:hypothetical protein